MGVKIPALLASYSGGGKAVASAGPRTTRPTRPISPQPALYTVEIITGGKISTKKFEGGK